MKCAQAGPVVAIADGILTVISVDQWPQTLSWLDRHISQVANCTTLVEQGSCMSFLTRQTATCYPRPAGVNETPRQDLFDCKVLVNKSGLFLTPADRKRVLKALDTTQKVTRSLGVKGEKKGFRTVVAHRLFLEITLDSAIHT